MVDLETEGAGLMVLRFHQPYAASDEAGYLAALETLGRMEALFALLAIFGGGPGLSPAGERAQALWFKRSRAGMEKYCRAMAMVRPGATPRMTEVFGKLWRFPLLATEDEAEARRFLAAHLGALP